MPGGTGRMAAGFPGIDGDSGIEAEVRALSWANARGNRTLIFNCNVPAVRKECVDMCLLSTDPQLCDEAVKNKGAYIALGELKGGLDPAGAKTNTGRRPLLPSTASAPRLPVSLITPSTFFIGAAIVSAMADEIWNQPQAGILTNAANLTNPDQLASISSWLVQL